MGAITKAEVGMRTAAAGRYYFESERETMPRDELAQLQLKRLRATLKNAYRTCRFTVRGLIPRVSTRMT